MNIYRILNKQIVAVAAIAFCFSLSVTAQNICGNVYSEEAVQHMEEAQARIDEGFVNLRISTYVPIRYHRVTTNDGEGGLGLSAILDAHDRLNRYYISLDMQYFLYEENGTLFNTFRSNNAYNDPSAFASQITMRGQESQRAMNVYCCGDIQPFENTEGVIQGFYSRSNDWMVMRNSQMDNFSNTLGHEAGHFFSLQHPHFGWEGCPETPGSACAPNTIPCNGGLLVEKQDGSNCATTGDRICDTPPDYNGLRLSCDGEFANILDPNCEQITPIRDNIMSYFDGCAEYSFTPDQTLRAQADYSTQRRNYLRPSVAPTLDSVESSPEIIYPLDSTGVGADTDVTLEWDAVDNASHYLVTYSDNAILSTRRGTVVQLITTDTEYTIENSELENEASYFYTVRAFNPYWSPPAAETEITMFYTGELVAIPSIDEINQFAVIPNPVTENYFTVALDLNEVVEAGVIEIMDITGNIVHSQLIENLSNGSHQIPVQTSNVPSGQYIVLLKSDDRAVHQRIVIQ